MAVIDRSEIENEYKKKLDKILDQIKGFESKCGNYFKFQPYLSQFFRPASQLIGHHLELLKWLLTSIYLLEMEFEFNNQITEKYSHLEEEVEDVCVIIKQLFNSKSLEVETYNSLTASKCEFDRNFSAIWANRAKSDHYFWWLWPKMNDELTRLMPIGFAKPNSDNSQLDESIIEFLTNISTFEDEASLKKRFDEFYDEVKKLNDFLNVQYESDHESVKAFLDLGNSKSYTEMFCKDVLCMQIN